MTATIVAAFRPPDVLVVASPAGPDTQMLQEMSKLLRTRPVEPGPANAELVEQLRQRDRSTLEAIKELAGAVNRVRNGISEIQHGLQHRVPEQMEPERFRGAGRYRGCRRRALRAATAGVTAAVAKLDDIAAGLTALSPIGVSPPARGNLPAGSRSQLSTELQELLRDMATAPASQPGRVPAEGHPVTAPPSRSLNWPKRSRPRVRRPRRAHAAVSDRIESDG